MKKNVLIIGAGGVAQVVAHKCAQNNDVLGDIHIASRTKAKPPAASEAQEPAHPARRPLAPRRGRASVDYQFPVEPRSNPSSKITSSGSTGCGTRAATS